MYVCLGGGGRVGGGEIPGFKTWSDAALTTRTPIDAVNPFDFLFNTIPRLRCVGLGGRTATRPRMPIVGIGQGFLLRINLGGIRPPPLAKI